MKKEDVLIEIKKAKAVHIEWVKRAKLLLDNVKLTNTLPIEATECEFGKWLNIYGKKISKLRNNPISCIITVEEIHFELHNSYKKLFNLYAKNKKSIFPLKKDKTLKLQEENLAIIYFKEIEELSEKLIEELNTMEKRVNVINYLEFQNLKDD